MNLISIVASSKNNVIGVDNKMPWHLPDDLKFFKKITTGYPIIMGKNTWLSIGEKPLPNRINIVLSKSLESVPEGVLVFPNLETATQWLAKEQGNPERVFIIGGGQLYKTTMDLISEIFITRVHTLIENGTAFFPEFSEDNWNLLTDVFHEEDDKHAFSFTFEHWVRKTV